MGRDAGLLATSSSASTRWTTAATRTAGPSTSRRSSRWPNLATKAGVEGRQHLRIHTPLIDLTKAQIIQRGLALGVDYALTHSCYDPDPDGQRLRHLRLLPAAPPRIRRSRHGRPGACPSAGAGGMTYRVKEIFYTLQGEGTHAGRPAVFCRFTSCNLWTGREKDRHRAVCQFCDTDFVGTDGPAEAGSPPHADLAAAVGCDMARSGTRASAAVRGVHRRRATAAAGRAAIEALHAAGFEVAVETNGTQAGPAGLDWVCVSPKAGAPLKLVQRR